MGMIGNTLAQGLISGANIVDGTVDTPDIKDSAVTTAKIADANITSAKLASGVSVANLGYTPVNKAGDTIGGGTFAKTGTVNLSFDNGGTDTPGVKFYYGNNTNFGIDVNNNKFRVVKNLDETGGVEVLGADTSGNFTIGASSSFDANTRLTISKAGNCQQFVRSTDGVDVFVSANGNTSGVLGVLTNHPLIFKTSDTERGRFNAAGGMTVNDSVTSPAFTTTGAFGAQATLGSGVTSWAGSAYPTLYGSSTERWVMHMNPHICYTVNGTNSYTGSMTGATIRFGGTPTYGSSWDVGIGCGGVGADIFTINRDNTSFYKLNNAGQGFFTQGNSFIDFGPNTTWSAKLRVGGNGNNDSAIATLCTTNGNLHMDAASSSAMYLNYYAGTGGVRLHNGTGNGGYGTLTYGTLTQGSDYRLKDNITPMADGAKSLLMQIDFKQYVLIGDESRQVNGVIADQLQQIMPHAVRGEKDAVDEEGRPEYQSVDYMQILSLTAKALQEVIAEFEAYKAAHP